MHPNDGELPVLSARLRLAVDIAEATSRSHNLDDVLGTALDHLMGPHSGTAGAVMVRSRTGSLRLGCARGLASTQDPFPELTSETEATGRSRVGPSPSPRGGTDGELSVASVPIWSGDQLVGVLHLARPQYEPYATDDVLFLEPLCRVLGSAISNARLYKALEDELRSSTTINRMARQITEGSLEIGQLLSRAGEALAGHFGLQGCRFFMVDTLRTALVSVSVDAALEVARIQMRAEPALAGILRDGRAVSSGSSPGLARLASLLGLDLADVAVVPLVTAGRAVGMAVLARDSAETRGFSRAELERLETIGAYIAGALENSRLYQESLDLNRDLIELDSVTQLNPSIGEPMHVAAQLLERAVLGTGSDLGLLHTASAETPAVVFDRATGAGAAIPVGLESRLASAARLSASEGRAVELRSPAAQAGSLLAVPLRSLSHEAGAMVLFKQSAIEERDRRLCSVVADRIGSIVDNARLFEQTQRHLEELQRRNVDLVNLNHRNVELTGKLSRQLEERRREAQLAADVQKSLLEDDTPQGKDLDVAVAYLPLEEASGDYYDVFRIDDHRIGIVITDAVGHGVPAAFVGGFSKMLLDVYKGWLVEGRPPGEVLGAINERLCSYGHNQLMTMFLGVYERGTRTFSYANGGHPYPIVFRGSEPARPLESGSHIMGAWVGPFEDRQVTLEPGDRVLLYTDGLVEAKNPSGSRLGKAPIVEWVSRSLASWPAELNQGLYSLMSDFAGGLIDHDDVTLLTLAVLDDMPHQGQLAFGTIEEALDTWPVVRAGLERFAYDARSQYSIRLALEESTANAVRHGCRDGTSASLSYSVDGLACQLEVRDQGTGFRPDELPDPTSPDKFSVAGGRGVFMIRRSVDAVFWNDQGNHITMTKKKRRRVDILANTQKQGVVQVADEIRVTLETQAGRPVLSVAGAADAVSAAVLSDGLAGLIARAPTGVLDLTGVSFLGSAAVSILVKGFTTAKTKGVKLVVVKPADHDVAEMLEILGLMGIFPAADSLQAALDLLA